jgi:hypothetical protein
MQVGRNDPCPCGSGKKFKKCCLQAHTYYLAEAPALLAQQPARSFAVSPGISYARNASPRQLASAFDHNPPAPMDDEPDAPQTEALPLLPVVVCLHYAFPEPFGVAEVTFIFPAGKIFVLESEQSIPVEPTFRTSGFLSRKFPRVTCQHSNAVAETPRRLSICRCSGVNSLTRVVASPPAGCNV